MAIAITLLILEVKIPEEIGHKLGAALLSQWPSYAAYGISFITIGIMWVNHHHMFNLIRRTDHMFLVLNVLFLLTVAALPWPTALVAAHLQDPEGRKIATLVYGGAMVAIAIMFNVIWRYASSGGRLLVDGWDKEEVRKSSRAYLVGPVMYLGATLLALANPWISQAIFAGLAIYYLLPVSGPSPTRVLESQEEV